jgi:hypothetical protein
LGAIVFGTRLASTPFRDRLTSAAQLVDLLLHPDAFGVQKWVFHNPLR